MPSKIIKNDITKAREYGLVKVFKEKPLWRYILDAESL